MEIWKFIYNKLGQGQKIFLLYVLESQGSSPGRRGFKMAVCGDGTFSGTIGGGIMEFKMVEKARNLLEQNNLKFESTFQYHDKAHGTDQSGMICSGSQFLAFIPMEEYDLPKIQEAIQYLSNGQEVSFHTRPNLWHFEIGGKEFWKFENEHKWFSIETLNKQPVIHIIGGGHVSLALSEMMNFLGFYVHVYDDRPELSTMEQNLFAHEKHIVDYAQVQSWLKGGMEEFVVIMTIGYRTDKLVLQQLLGMPFQYLGMLGSQKKIEVLMDELSAEGHNNETLKAVFAPIGLPIYSQTTKEIAVSIAAEIIKEKNKNLPSGRSHGA